MNIEKQNDGSIWIIDGATSIKVDIIPNDELKIACISEAIMHFLCDTEGLTDYEAYCTLHSMPDVLFDRYGAFTILDRYEDMSVDEILGDIDYLAESFLKFAELGGKINVKTEICQI